MRRLDKPSLAALVAVIAAALLGALNAGTSAAQVPGETYAGTTSQGYGIELEVSSDGTKLVRWKARADCGASGAEWETTYSPGFGLAITGGQFDTGITTLSTFPVTMKYRIQGSFSPVSHAEGTLTFFVGSAQCVHTWTAEVAIDSDGDGVFDPVDNCPATPNPGQADSDGDSDGDACDNCPATPNPGQADSDGDSDGDACDNCPATPNPSQADSDGDSDGDACDNCPATPNPGQADSDGDNDGDVCDNCPNTVNPDQRNSDNDSQGDACDPDDDNDDVPDGSDNCPTTQNPAQTDTDGDLAGDLCDAPGSGNVDCSEPPVGVTSVDSLKVLRANAGLSVAQNEPCLDIGLARLLAAPNNWKMGDVDCSGTVNSVDALKILRAVAGLSVAKPVGCPEVKPPG